jgi:hypothetical protein
MKHKVLMRTSNKCVKKKDGCVFHVWPPQSSKKIWIEFNKETMMLYTAIAEVLPEVVSSESWWSFRLDTDKSGKNWIVDFDPLGNKEITTIYKELKQAIHSMQKVENVVAQKVQS